MKKRIFCQVLVLAGLVVMVGVWGTAPARAGPVTVVANFTDGNDETTFVDAWHGIAGLGWTGPWAEAVYQGAMTASVQESQPVDGGGKYLDYSMTRSDEYTGNIRGAVARSYSAGIDLAEDHTISFKYRIDEDLSLTFTTTGGSEYYAIYDYNQPWSQPMNGSTWQITGSPGEVLVAPQNWFVCDGGYDGTFTPIDTELELQQGVVYDFQIHVRASTKTWDVRIENLTTAAVYNSTDYNPNGLGWRGNPATVGGTLNFGARCSDEYDVREFSMDSLSITGAGKEPYGGRDTVEAHFTHGNDDTTYVDAYHGVAGDGWKTAWGEHTGGSPTYTATVLSSGDDGFNEVKPGLGSYLSFTEGGEDGTSSPYLGVGRNYKSTAAPGIDWTQPHTIEFTIRIDEDVDDPDLFIGSEDRYAIYDRESVYGKTDSHDRWCIIASGKDTTGVIPPGIAGEWTFYDGDNAGTWDIDYMLDTDIAMHTGHVYDFTIVVDPENQSYDATVSDVTDPQNPLSCTLTDLGWRTSSTELGGVINFTARDDYTTSDDTRAFSLDALVITQSLEPIPGDATGDGHVDDDDAQRLAECWGATELVGEYTWWEMGDFDDDHFVGPKDAAIMAANWGYGPGEGSAAGVPEPSTVILLLAAMASLLAWRRR